MGRVLLVAMILAAAPVLAQATGPVLDGDEPIAPPSAPAIAPPIAAPIAPPIAPSECGLSPGTVVVVALHGRATPMRGILRSCAAGRAVLALAEDADVQLAGVDAISAAAFAGPALSSRALVDDLARSLIGTKVTVTTRDGAKLTGRVEKASSDGLVVAGSAIPASIVSVVVVERATPVDVRLPLDLGLWTGGMSAATGAAFFAMAFAVSFACNIDNPCTLPSTTTAAIVITGVIGMVFGPPLTAVITAAIVDPGFFAPAGAGLAAVVAFVPAAFVGLYVFGLPLSFLGPGLIGTGYAILGALLGGAVGASAAAGAAAGVIAWAEQEYE